MTRDFERAARNMVYDGGGWDENYADQGRSDGIGLTRRQTVVPEAVDTVT